MPKCGIPGTGDQRRTLSGASLPGEGNDLADDIVDAQTIRQHVCHVPGMPLGAIISLLVFEVTCTDVLANLLKTDLYTTGHEFFVPAPGALIQFGEHPDF